MEAGGFKNVNDLLQLHKKYFEESYSLAVEHRYMHEHGTAGPRQLKPEASYIHSTHNGSKHVDLNRSETTVVDSRVSTVDARSKFEQALLSATAAVKTRSDVSAANVVVNESISNESSPMKTNKILQELSTAGSIGESTGMKTSRQSVPCIYVVEIY